MEKVDNMNEQIENFSRDKNYICQMEMLEIENMVIEMKNAFKKLINTLDTTRKKSHRSSVDEDISTEITQTKIRREKSMENTQKSLKRCGITSKSLTKVYLEYQEEREIAEEIFE